MITRLKTLLAAKKKNEKILSKKIKEATELAEKFEPNSTNSSIDLRKLESKPPTAPGKSGKITSLKTFKDSIKKGGQLQTRKEQAKGFEALIILTAAEKAFKKEKLEHVKDITIRLDEIQDQLIDLRERDLWLKGEINNA